MQGKKIGYIRVSSVDQNTDRQLDGMELDKTFTDKASGKDMKRPQLEALLEYVREGDVVVVHSLDRLARNLWHLGRLVDTLTAKQVAIQFVKENLTFTGKDSPMSTLMLSVMGAFAQFERSLIHERQMEGIALAKKRGAYNNRKTQACLNKEQLAVFLEHAARGDSKTHLAKEFGICRQSVYAYLKANQ